MQQQPCQTSRFSTPQAAQSQQLERRQTAAPWAWPGTAPLIMSEHAQQGATAPPHHKQDCNRRGRAPWGWPSSAPRRCPSTARAGPRAARSCADRPRCPCRAQSRRGRRRAAWAARAPPRRRPLPAPAAARTRMPRTTTSCRNEGAVASSSISMMQKASHHQCHSSRQGQPGQQRHVRVWPAPAALTRAACPTAPAGGCSSPARPAPGCVSAGAGRQSQLVRLAAVRRKAARQAPNLQLRSGQPPASRQQAAAAAAAARGKLPLGGRWRDLTCLAQGPATCGCTPEARALGARTFTTSSGFTTKALTTEAPAAATLLCARLGGRGASSGSPIARFMSGGTRAAA